MRIQFPLRTVSGLNAREHFMARSRRVKRERIATKLAWRSGLLEVLRQGGILAHLPAVVLLTRISPGTLDDDNLRGALKGVRDEVAKQLGVDDRDQAVRWSYAQEKGKAFAVRIEVKSA